MLKNKIAFLIGATLLLCNIEAASSSSPLSRRLTAGSPIVSEHDFLPSLSALTAEERKQIIRKQHADRYWHSQGKENPYGRYLDQTTASSALLHAAERNDFDTVKDAIAHGASINIVSGSMPENFKSPADFAAINNNIPCLEYILITYRDQIYDNPRCSSNRCEYIPKRALKYAIRNGNTEAIKTIVTIVPEIVTQELYTEILRIVHELQTPWPFMQKKVISKEVIDAMMSLIKEKLDAAS